MDTSSTSTDITGRLAADARMLPEDFRRELVETGEKIRRAIASNPRRAGKTAAAERVIRRTYRGRQVLAPTTRKTARPNTRLKAARHPWADRLHAARTGGLVIEQRGDAVLYRCHGCGEGGGIAGQSSGTDEDYATHEHFREELHRHETGACVTGVTP